MDWFLYDNGLRDERVKGYFSSLTSFCFSLICFYFTLLYFIILLTVFNAGKEIP